jgi:excisionase family DNA binding protein
MLTELPGVLTAAEVGEWLQCSKSKVIRLARQGELPGIKLGRDWRFSRQQLERWFEEQAA